MASPQHIGTERSKTRAALLDSSEQLILLESYRVGDKPLAPVAIVGLMSSISRYLANKHAQRLNPANVKAREGYCQVEAQPCRLGR